MKLAAEVSRIICAKGKQVVEFNMRTDPPPQAILLKHMLGPTGNLRAPTIRAGKTLLVGFNETAYSEALR